MPIWVRVDGPALVVRLDFLCGFGEDEGLPRLKSSRKVPRAVPAYEAAAGNAPGKLRFQIGTNGSCHPKPYTGVSAGDLLEAGLAFAKRSHRP